MELSSLLSIKKPNNEIMTRLYIILFGIQENLLKKKKIIKKKTDGKRNKKKAKKESYKNTRK